MVAAEARQPAVFRPLLTTLDKELMAAVASSRFDLAQQLATVGAFVANKLESTKGAAQKIAPRSTSSHCGRVQRRSGGVGYANNDRTSARPSHARSSVLPCQGQLGTRSEFVVRPERQGSEIAR